LSRRRLLTRCAAGIQAALLSPFDPRRPKHSISVRITLTLIVIALLGALALGFKAVLGQWVPLPRS
jgi:hypothetical protein